MIDLERHGHHGPRPVTGDEGYLLLGLVVVCFLLLLALGVAAPRVAKQLERDREVEAEHRAQEYVRAIQLYYRKNNSFPTSVDQLLGGGSSGISSAAKIKYLRQQYKDPLTNDDFRLIHLGEAKTEVKGFFGEPLQGIATGTMGTPASALGSSTSSSSSPGNGVILGPASSTAGTGTIGTPSATAPDAGLSFGSSGTASSTPGGTSILGGNSTSSAAGGLGATTATGTGTSSSTSASSFQGSKGAIVGVGSNAKGHGLVEWNGSENIEDWEFLYDPRVELLKAKVSLLGGGVSTAGSGSLGSGSLGSGTLGSGSNTFGSSGSNGAASGSGSAGSTGAGSSGSSNGSGTSPNTTP